MSGHLSAGLMVEQAQLELQLKVWKELAISKQMLMRTAAEALKLDPNCSQEELKVALDAALKKVADADQSVIIAREQAKSTILGMEQKLAAAQKAQAASETLVTDLTAKLENTSQQAAAARASSAKEIQTLKDRVLEKDKQLKAINTALADTPENVLKKMNVLKKQRQEEADARREVESSFTTLRKEKNEQDQKMTRLTDNTTKLIEQYRELHVAAAKIHEQLKPLLQDEKELPVLPDLHAKLLEEIENPDAKPDAKANGKDKDKK
jgi:chromosome segregation ATPase